MARSAKCSELNVEAFRAVNAIDGGAPCTHISIDETTNGYEVSIDGSLTKNQLRALADILEGAGS